MAHNRNLQVAQEARKCEAIHDAIELSADTFRERCLRCNRHLRTPHPLGAWAQSVVKIRSLKHHRLLHHPSTIRHPRTARLIPLIRISEERRQNQPLVLQEDMVPSRRRQVKILSSETPLRHWILRQSWQQIRKTCARKTMLRFRNSYRLSK